MSYSFEGINELQLTMQEVAELPDATKDAMLKAGADVLVSALKKKIEALGLVKTGSLLNSIRAFRKLRRGEVIYKIYPYGKHGVRNRKAVTKVYTQSKHGRTYTVGGDTVDVTNNEVGFIHEFGAPRRGIPAKMWMASTVEESADAVVAAEAAVYDQYLRSKGL